MNKNPSGWCQALLLAVIVATDTRAAPPPAFEPEIALLSAVPFTVRLIDHRLITQAADSRNRFRLDDQLRPGETIIPLDKLFTLGVGHTPTHQLQGYFLFHIEELGINFSLDYRLTQDRRDLTGAIARADSGKPHPFVKVIPLKKCTEPQRLDLANIPYAQSCIFLMTVQWLDIIAACGTIDLNSRDYRDCMICKIRELSQPEQHKEL